MRRKLLGENVRAHFNTVMTSVGTVEGTAVVPRIWSYDGVYRVTPFGLRISSRTELLVMSYSTCDLLRRYISPNGTRSLIGCTHRVHRTRLLRLQYNSATSRCAGDYS